MDLGRASPGALDYLEARDAYLHRDVHLHGDGDQRRYGDRDHEHRLHGRGGAVGANRLARVNYTIKSPQVSGVNDVHDRAVLSFGAADMLPAPCTSTTSTGGSGGSPSGGYFCQRARSSRSRSSARMSGRSNWSTGRDPSQRGHQGARQRRRDGSAPSGAARGSPRAWSEWSISPDLGRRRASACRSAWRTSCSSIRSPIDQPTPRREKQSTATASTAVPRRCQAA
jgi:hypothetical protein